MPTGRWNYDEPAYACPGEGLIGCYRVHNWSDRGCSGRRHSLALKADGTVWAWGYNANGQLGDSTCEGKLTPVRVKDPTDPSGFLTGVKAIAAGSIHSIALKNNKTVWTWGSQAYVRIGRNRASPPQNVAGQVAGITNVIAIAGGWEHTVVLKGDNTVWAAGRNLEGQLGDGTPIGSSLSPLKLFVQVIDPTDPPDTCPESAIGANDRHAVAVKQNGTVYGWGWNTGASSATPPRTTSHPPKDERSFRPDDFSDGGFQRGRRRGIQPDAQSRRHNLGLRL